MQIFEADESVTDQELNDGRNQQQRLRHRTVFRGYRSSARRPKGSGASSGGMHRRHNKRWSF